MAEGGVGVRVVEHVERRGASDIDFEGSVGGAVGDAYLDAVVGGALQQGDNNAVVLASGKLLEAEIFAGVQGAGHGALLRGVACGVRVTLRAERGRVVPPADVRSVSVPTDVVPFPPPLAVELTGYGRCMFRRREHL